MTDTPAGASFAENFYGLKRRRVLGTGSDKTKAAVELTGQSDKLGPREIRASLASLVRPRLVDGGRVDPLLVPFCVALADSDSLS